MPERRRKFLPSFGRGGQDGDRRDCSIAQVARELGVNPGTLGNWVAQYRKAHPVEEEPPSVPSRPTTTSEASPRSSCDSSYRFCSTLDTATHRRPTAGPRPALDRTGTPRVTPRLGTRASSPAQRHIQLGDRGRRVRSPTAIAQLTGLEDRLGVEGRRAGGHRIDATCCAHCLVCSCRWHEQAGVGLRLPRRRRVCR